MPSFVLKPAHKPIQNYDSALRQFDDLGVTHEGAVKSAFHGLLDHCARQHEWTLVPEWEIRRPRQHPLRAGGALLDNFRLTHGFWEAKDIRDDPRRNMVAAEIEKVIDALASQSFSRAAFLKKFDRFCLAIEQAAATIADFSQKQQLLNTVYEKFFQGSCVKVAETHGIVYTPPSFVAPCSGAWRRFWKRNSGKRSGLKGWAFKREMPSVESAQEQMADVFSKRKRSQVMAAIRSRGNKGTELKLASMLRAHGIKGWRRHQRLPGSPDFVFRRERLAVFVDGCFWHGCPKHGRKPDSNRGYWLPKLRRNKQRDRTVSRNLRNAGWSVLRLWAHALNKPAAVARRLASRLSDG